MPNSYFDGSAYVFEDEVDTKTLLILNPESGSIFEGNISASGNLTTTEITASGNISASGHIQANNLLLKHHPSYGVDITSNAGSLVIKNITHDDDYGSRVLLDPNVANILSGHYLGTYGFLGEKSENVYDNNGVSSYIAAVATEDQSSTKNGSELIFNVTPKGEGNSNTLLTINAESGSIFSGSVIADRFVTKQDYQRPSASAAPIIGEDFHGAAESGILRITGSIPSSDGFETDLFRVPSYNDSIQFNARVKFIDNGSYVVGAELTAQSTWDSSSLSLDGDNSHIDGFATLPPNYNDYDLYYLFNVSTGPVGFVGISNFSLDGPSGGYITYKWSNNGADISLLAGYDYEMIIDYTVYKF